MRDFEWVYRRWLEVLDHRGYPTNLVWLPHEAMVLHDALYVRAINPPLAPNEVKEAFSLLSDSEPGVFMLVTATDQSYVTLLMDPFGSDDDVFLSEQNFYFFARPYVPRIELVHSDARWLWLKHVRGRLSPQLSSLDYAFSIHQAGRA